jgi:hypothetical protein
MKRRFVGSNAVICANTMLMPGLAKASRTGFDKQNPFFVLRAFLR